MSTHHAVLHSEAVAHEGLLLMLIGEGWCYILRAVVLICIFIRTSGSFSIFYYLNTPLIAPVI